jgi:hypothetical protein
MKMFLKEYREKIKNMSDLEFEKLENEIGKGKEKVDEIMKLWEKENEIIEKNSKLIFGEKLFKKLRKIFSSLVDYVEKLYKPVFEIGIPATKLGEIIGPYLDNQEKNYREVAQLDLTLIRKKYTAV